MSSHSLVEHAKRELSLLPKEDRKVHDQVLKAIEVLAGNDDHSGASFDIMVNMLFSLISFRNLSPLTDNPDEWTDLDGKGLLQSKRNAYAFSTDGGKTYYEAGGQKKEDGSNVTYPTVRHNKNA